MTLDETIEMFTSNAEYERTHGNLQGCLEIRQLAEWLKDYKRLKEQEPKTGHQKSCDTCEYSDEIDGSNCYECVKGMRDRYNPQESNVGYISIDDVMSVFDDFMCGEVDEEGTETFLEMLKDKAESEEE